MFDLKFKGLFIVNNYAKNKIATIATTKYDKTLIPLLCLAYQKLDVFVEPSTNYVAQQ
jgi:hypothetical protein